VDECARRCDPARLQLRRDILARNLDAGRAHKPAFVEQNRSLTYGRLAPQGRLLGRMLRVRGIRREERILICLHDTLDWPTAFLGAIKFGAIPVPVNT